MEISIRDYKGKAIAEIKSDGVLIKNAQDALEILANCAYQGATNLILEQHQVSDEFFDLKTGLAGDVLQKFSNYQSRLAIVGDFSIYTSKSLKDFIRESNRMGRIRFVGTFEEAREAFL